MTPVVEEGAAGVGVGEVGGQKVLVAELLENHFGHEQLLIREREEVQHVGRDSAAADLCDPMPRPAI